MNNLKRLTFNILSVLMVFSLIACSSNGKETEEIQQEIITEETDFYRNILVAEFKGTSNITRNTGDNFEVYEGLSLNDGDDVKVNDHSDLTLNVDSDKHLYADENTHFWIIASGSEGNTKTKIKLEKGSVLCQIKNKLLENEFFEIETASSTMSVRGTVYRVSIIKGVKEDEVYELVEVFNGGVATLINENGESVSLNPGEAALIKEKQDGSDARFVKDDEIDEDFWSSSDLNFNIETDEGEGSPILKISYEKISEGALDKLVEIADEGQQELAVEKEVLEEVKETGHNYKVIQRIEPTCTKDGLVISKCTICNQEMQEVLPKISHNFIKVSETASTCTSTGLIINRCTMCNQETTQTLAMGSHNYVQTDKKAATCEEDGFVKFECTVCRKNKEKILLRTGHNLNVEDYNAICINCKQKFVYSGFDIKEDNYTFEKGKIMSAVPFADYGGYEKEVDIAKINGTMVYAPTDNSTTIELPVCFKFIVPVNGEKFSLFDITSDEAEMNLSDAFLKEIEILLVEKKVYPDSVLLYFQENICMHNNNPNEYYFITTIDLDVATNVGIINYQGNNDNTALGTANVTISNVTAICNYCGKDKQTNMTVMAEETSSTSVNLKYFYEDTYINCMKVSDTVDNEIKNYFNVYDHDPDVAKCIVIRDKEYVAVDNQIISAIIKYDILNCGKARCLHYSHCSSNCESKYKDSSWGNDVDENIVNQLNSYLNSLVTTTSS